jgi:hypothetical protein
MAFQKGLDKVQASAERSNFSGGRSRFIGWKAGETKTIRFLTDGDDVVLTNLHEFVTCSDGQKRSFVCRQEVGQDCPLCEDGAKRREVGYGIAVQREAVKEGGKTVYKTKVEETEVEEDGKSITKMLPVVGILHQAPKNFWAGAGIYNAFEKSGTILDRDFSITRRGAKLDTTYTAYLEDKQDLDLAKFDALKPDLEEHLSWQASKEYYDRFLFGIEKAKEGEESSAAASDLTPEDLEALKAANTEVASSAASGDWD